MWVQWADGEWQSWSFFAFNRNYLLVLISAIVLYFVIHATMTKPEKNNSKQIKLVHFISTFIQEFFWLLLQLPVVSINNFQLMYTARSVLYRSSDTFPLFLATFRPSQRAHSKFRQIFFFFGSFKSSSGDGSRARLGIYAADFFGCFYERHMVHESFCT